jgi:hypothetical protein
MLCNLVDSTLAAGNRFSGFSEFYAMDTIVLIRDMSESLQACLEVSGLSGRYVQQLFNYSLSKIVVVVTLKDGGLVVSSIFLRHVQQSVP